MVPGRTNTRKYAEKSLRPNTVLLHSIVLYLYGQCCSDMCLACCQPGPVRLWPISVTASSVMRHCALTVPRPSPRPSDCTRCSSPCPCPLPTPRACPCPPAPGVPTTTCRLSMQPREPAQDPASSLFTLDLGTSSNYTRQTVIDTLMIDDYISREIKLKPLAQLWADHLT